MRLSSSTLSAVVFGAFILAVAWLVSNYMPPPWPCDYDKLDKHPKALALIEAARSACAPGQDSVSIDLDRVWPADWRRAHFLKPYHGNHEVVRRVGFDLEIMACTRSHNADEWTQVVLEGQDGGRVGFDLPTHLLVRPPETLSSRSPGRPKNDLAPSGGGTASMAVPGAQLIRGGARLAVNCAALPARR